MILFVADIMYQTGEWGEHAIGLAKLHLRISSKPIQTSRHQS